MYKEELVSPQIGMESCVGCSGPYPRSFGNYFDLRCGLRIVNFWSENLRELVRLGIIDNTIKVRNYEKWALIADERIPKEWYYNKLCFTGCYKPPLNIIKDMYQYNGDPDNCFEEYENPASYFDRKGYIYKKLGAGYSLQRKE